MNTILLNVLACGGSLAALATLYRSWKTSSGRWFTLALLVSVASCVLWSFAQGWQLGVTYALCLPGMLVWLFISRNTVQLKAVANIPTPKSLNIAWRTAGFHSLHFLALFVILMVAALFSVLAVVRMLPLVVTQQLALGIVILPVLWGLFSYHYLATKNKRNVVIGYTLLSVLCVPALLYLPGWGGLQ